MPDFRCRISDAGFQMPDFRCQISDAGCQMPDFRCQMPDVRLQKSRILKIPFPGQKGYSPDLYRGMTVSMYCDYLNWHPASDIWHLKNLNWHPASGNRQLSSKLSY